MSAPVSVSSGSNLPIRVGDTLNIGVRPGSTDSKSSSSAPAGKVLTAQQGATAVAKGLANATSIYTALTSLQYQTSRAIKSDGSAPDAATIKTLSAEIASAKKQIDQLADGAKSGEANLLAGKTSSVSVATTSGVRVDIATQALDTKSLGLDKISVSDASSLRAAAGKIAQALGQAQLAVYRLQTANSAVGASTTNVDPASSAYDKVLGSQKAGASANSASASVEKALSNQTAANTLGYGGSGASSTLGSSRSKGIFSLLS